MTDLINLTRIVPPPPTFAPIARNRLLALLPPSDYALLSPHLGDILLNRGAVLQDAAEPAAYVYFPHSGAVSLLCAAPSAQMVETASIGRESAVGISSGLAAPMPRYRAVVQLPGTAARIAAARFAEALAESETLRDLATSQHSALLRQTQQNVVCGALHVVRARICRWLTHARDRCAADTLPLTQEAVAQALGVQRTTVTLVLRLLQDDGLIRTMRGRILIRDAAAIEAQACSCYAIVRDLTVDVLPSPSLAIG